MELQEEIKTVGYWMSDISAVLGVDLQLNSEGICNFQVGTDVVVTIEVSQDFPMVNIFSSLIVLPSDNLDAATLLMARALELNAFQVMTRGGAIAIAPGGGLLIFCFSTPIEGIDSEKFSKILGGFFETVTDLKAVLSESLGLGAEHMINNRIANEPKRRPIIMMKV